MISCLLATLTGVVTLAPLFENLGKPVAERSLSFNYVTEGPDGNLVAWAILRGEEEQGAIGIDTVTGKVHRVDLQQYGASNVRLAKGPDGALYVFAGQPGRYFRYQPVSGELTELGQPSPAASYWMRQNVSRDHVFYVGTYPRAELVACDMKTGAIRTVAALNDDPSQKYIIDCAPDEHDGWVYCAVGLHHRELWAVNPADGSKRQILPEKLTAAQGAPEVWTATDGSVYGRSGPTTFRCFPDRIEPGDVPPSRGPDRARLPSGELVAAMGDNGLLRLAKSADEERLIPTAYRGTPLRIYTVGPLHDGVLYGSGLKPGHFFTYRPATGESVDHGTVTSGSIQVYDMVVHRTGIFIGSYTGASIDRLDPSQPIARGKNPTRVIQLSLEHQQERPEQLIVGPDNAVWIGSVPVKGRLGGALSRIDPADLSAQCWRDVVPDQSITTLVSLPDRNQLLLGSSVRGGTSAAPKATEAVLALWDIATSKVVDEFRPVAGARQYQGLALTANGMVHGLATTADGLSRFVFDPAKQTTVLAEPMPLRRSWFPYLHDAQVGPKKLLVGLADDAIFGIDPADNSVTILAQDKSVFGALGFWVTDDGMVYYGSGATLWRCSLGW